MMKLSFTLAAILIGVIGGELFFLPQPGTDRMSVSLAPNDAAPTMPPARSADLAETILARPLFSPDRRPVVDRMASGGQFGLPRVTAILIDGNRKQVIFAGHQSGHISIAAGGFVGQYRVELIAPDHVDIAGPEGRYTLRPRFDISKEPAASDNSPPLNLFGMSMLHPPQAALHGPLSTKSDSMP